ncbi:MAG TPA: hypothetical protein VFH06_00185 [Candidatus Saccharimonadales bacterium]|nr:hypothetical protein [Candidatus Saccharimonadales bacterium]
MNGNTPLLDEIFARACAFVEENREVTLRGINFHGCTHSGIEWTVKAYSHHPEVTGNLPVIGAPPFDPQQWLAELASTGRKAYNPGPWEGVVFFVWGGAIADLPKQLARILVADYLTDRIRRERSDLLELEMERREQRTKVKH